MNRHRRSTPLVFILIALAASACSASFGSTSDKITVSPKGAPYQYRVPDGFAVANKITDLGSQVGNAVFETGVGIDQHNIIIVRVYQLRRSVVGVSDSQIKNELDAVLVTAAGSAQIAGQSRQLVAGVNAFVYTFHQLPLTGTVKGDETNYFLFKGRNEVEVSCQWVQKPDTIRRGCRQLLASLVVR